MTGSLTELIERYVDALIQDPQAYPPPGLDDTDAAFVRDMVRARPVPPTDDVLRARIWQRALSAAIAERLASSKTTRDTVDVYPTARASSNTNGRYQEEVRLMSTLVQHSTLDRTMPVRPQTGPRRNFWTLAATAAACVIVVVGLVVVGSLRPPKTSHTGSGMGQVTASTVTASPTPTALPPIGGPPVIPVVYQATMIEAYQLAPGTHLEGFAWKPDTTRLLTWGAEGTVGLADAATGQLIAGMLGGSDPSDDPFDGGAWSPDGLRVMVWRSTGTVRVWDLMTTAITEFEHGPTRLFGARWSPDGSQIVTWGASHAVNVWDAASGTKLLTLPHSATVNGAAWNADGSRLLTWAENGYLYEWDSDGTNVAAPYQGIIDPQTGDLQYIPVTGATWGDDHGLIMSWSDTGYVWLWDYASWPAANPVYRFYGHFSDHLNGAALNPVDDRIVCWSDTAIYLYAPSDPENTVAHPLLHDGKVGGAVWSADGTRILVWSEDATVRVWDAATVTQVAYLPHGAQVVQGAQWSADNTRIFHLEWQHRLDVGTHPGCRIDPWYARPYGDAYRTWIKPFVG